MSEVIDKLSEQIRDSGMDAVGLRDAAIRAVAEIKRLESENQILRRGLKGDYDLDAWLDWAQEAESLRTKMHIMQDRERKNGRGFLISLDGGDGNYDLLA